MFDVVYTNTPLILAKRKIDHPMNAVFHGPANVHRLANPLRIRGQVANKYRRFRKTWPSISRATQPSPPNTACPHLLSTIQSIVSVPTHRRFPILPGNFCLIVGKQFFMRLPWRAAWSHRASRRRSLPSPSRCRSASAGSSSSARRYRRNATAVFTVTERSPITISLTRCAGTSIGIASTYCVMLMS
ncbi:hypothetical protein LMG29542_07949 [Paraburkholderia humisilvae]|uniref:Uncharacterized protein n=1 Tax=Paraburkholderia humisilvae TaxID=627669 RepID=A0A6J5F9U2_9BURK|nr:hypothetical protein LMG29542_07949 [Paraburkholderia humisilvae]